jgi:hypothetical protein
MVAVRSALLVLALGLLTTPSAASASSGGSSSGARDGVAAARQLLDSSIATPVFIPLPDPSSCSRPVRRKAYLKAALEETDRELEEADLGPVYVLHGRHSRPSIPSASPAISTTCRLRC